MYEEWVALTRIPSDRTTFNMYPLILIQVSDI